LKRHVDSPKYSERASPAGDARNSSHSHNGSHGCEHSVQFYENDEFLVDSVAQFVGVGVAGGGGGIVIATPGHREALATKFRENGLDLFALQSRRQIVFLDAVDTLAKFMVQGMPDRALFQQVIGSLVAEMTRERRALRAYGEMVAVLWQDGNPLAAIHLEELWNELGTDHHFSLLCGYPIKSFGAPGDVEAFAQVCRAHSRVIPCESYFTDQSEDEKSRTIAALQQKASALEAEISSRKLAEDRLRDFIETAAQPLHQVAPDGTILWANQAELDLLGYRRDEYIGHNLREFHADKPVIDEILARLARGERLRNYAARLKHTDGSIRTVLIDSTVRWENGSFLYTQCFTRDITEQHRAEEALRQSQARLETELADSKLLQSVSAELISEQDINALYQKLVNAAVTIMRSDFASMQMFYPERGALRLLASHGFSEEAQHCWEWVCHETPSSCGEVLRSGRRVVATNVEECEFLVRMGGLQAYLAAGIRAMQSTPLISRSGKLVGMISTHWRGPHKPSDRDFQLFDILARQAADVIERVGAEDRLRQSEERLAADLRAMTLLYDLGNECVQSNDDKTRCLEKILDTAIDLSHAAKGNLQLFDKSSDALVIAAQRGFSQKFLDFFASVRNETSTACGVAMKSGERIVVEDVANNEIFATQPSREILLGENVRALQSTPLVSATGNLLGMISTHFARTHSPSERELRMFDLLARQTADYLERKDAESKFAESEARYRTLFESIDQGFCTIEVLFSETGKAVDYRFLLVNPAFERQTGIANATGRRMREIAPLHEEHWFEIFGKIALTGEALRFENRAAQLGRYYEGYAWRLDPPEGRIVGILFNDITNRQRAEETERRLAAIVEHSDDAIISTDLDAIIRSWNRGAERLYGYTAQEAIGQPVSILIPSDREDEEPRILERIRRGETVEHYETVRCQKNGTRMNISLTVSPLKDGDGRVVGASKVARDISDKVRARETLEQTVVERTERLRDTVAELEAFSYSIAHDMRAPLRAMRGYSQFLQSDFEASLPEEGKEFLRRIAAGAARLDKLITDVLNYSTISRNQMPLENVDVEKLIGEILELYPNIRQAGTLIFVTTPIPPVTGNAAALTQCISNLISNAVKFVAPGTTPQVRIWAESRGEVVRVCFEDNGIGISVDGQKQIFRMFQRLNPAAEFEGTGIGLTIVRKAVERMGGNVGVQSELGVGSRFWIELPRAISVSAVNRGGIRVNS
jgi:PAS domain S-box-containing protein